MSQEKKQMNYTRLLLGIQGTTFVFKKAEIVLQLYNGVCNFLGLYFQKYIHFQK